MKYKFKLPCNVIISGSTKSGKSYLTTNLLRDQLIPQVDYLIIFSPTIKIGNDYQEFKENDDEEKGVVIKKFSENFREIFDEVVVSQKHILEQHKNNVEEIPSILFIFDDMLGDPMLRLGGKLDKFSSRSRHYNISMFILVQKITAIPRTLRLNTANTILFNCANYSELERFLEEYCPKKYKKTLQNHLEEIYNQDYNFILTQNFCRKLKDRLLLNGDENIIEKFS